jgi:hypothetical protein
MIRPPLGVVNTSSFPGLLATTGISNSTSTGLSPMVRLPALTCESSVPEVGLELHSKP